MLKHIILTLLLASLPVASALAQAPENPFSNAGDANKAGQGTEGDTPADGSAGRATPPAPGAKPDLLLRMTKKDCEKVLRRHDVAGADYVAGLDVRGNHVAGADLQGTLTAADILPEEIAFELSLNPLGFAGNETLEETFSNSSAGFGMVRYNLSSGALTLGGKRLNVETEKELIEICRQALER